MYEGFNALYTNTCFNPDFIILTIYQEIDLI